MLANEMHVVTSISTRTECQNLGRGQLRLWVRTAVTNVTKRNVLPIVSGITFVLNAELKKKRLWLVGQSQLFPRIWNPITSIFLLQQPYWAINKGGSKTRPSVWMICFQQCYAGCLERPNAGNIVSRKATNSPVANS